MTERLLLAVLLAEAAVVLAWVVVILGHAAFSSVRARRYGSTVQRAREMLRRVVLAEAPPQAGVEAIRSIPLDLALRVLLELGRPLGGQSLRRLEAVAVAAGLTRRAERWRRSPRWWRRLRGVRLLAELEPDKALLLPCLEDRHPAVRAAAADAVARAPSPRAVQKLLDMLDDDDPQCRFAARTALLRCGRAASTAVNAYLGADQVPRPAAALHVALAVADPSFLPPALRLSRANADAPTRQRATELLARTAGEAAVRRLTELLEDPDSGVRARAAHGLADLGHWPAARALAHRLEDPSWDARSAAALALRRLGPAGRIYLRQAERAPDALAGDIARQVLALPEDAMSVLRA